MEEDRVRIIKSIPLVEKEQVNYFAKLPRDIIIYIALMLESADILSYCNISEKFDKTICQNKQFWVQKLERMGIDYYKTKATISPRSYYDKAQILNKNGKYYNFWEGEISGQLSDGMWQDGKYDRYSTRFTYLIPFIGYGLLFLGAAQRVGLNIKDDPWIENIAWVFSKLGIKYINVVDYIKNNDTDGVLNLYLSMVKSEGNKYWIDKANSMIKNKDKMKLIWGYIKTGKYDSNSLVSDLNEFNDYYNDNGFFISDWKLKY